MQHMGEDAEGGTVHIAYDSVLRTIESKAPFVGNKVKVSVGNTCPVRRRESIA
jgi:hypothetical protein